MGVLSYLMGIHQPYLINSPFGGILESLYMLNIIQDTPLINTNNNNNGYTAVTTPSTYPTLNHLKLFRKYLSLLLPLTKEERFPKSPPPLFLATPCSLFEENFLYFIIVVHAIGTINLR